MIEKAKECEINLGLQYLAISVVALQGAVEQLENQLEPILMPTTPGTSVAVSLCSASPMGVAIESATQAVRSLEGRVATLLSNLAVSA